MKTLVLGALIVCTVAQAEEKRIAESELPRAVRDGVARRYPGARRLRCERATDGGTTTYEVRIVNAAGHPVDVELAPDGRILAEEEQVSLDAAPEPVRRALAASRFAGWAVKRTEKVLHADAPDAPVYELLVSNGKSAAELVLAADGRLVKSEPKRPGDED